MGENPSAPGRDGEPLQPLSPAAQEFYERIGKPTYASLPPDEADATVRFLAYRHKLSAPEIQTMLVLLRAAARGQQQRPTAHAPSPPARTASPDELALQPAPKDWPTGSAPARGRKDREASLAQDVHTALGTALRVFCIVAALLLLGWLGYVVYRQFSDAGTQVGTTPLDNVLAPPTVKPPDAPRPRDGGNPPLRTDPRVATNPPVVPPPVVPPPVVAPPVVSPPVVSPPVVAPPVVAPPVVPPPVVPPPGPTADPPTEAPKPPPSFAQARILLRANLPVLESTWQAMPRGSPRQLQATWADIAKLARIEAVLVACITGNNAEAEHWKEVAAGSGMPVDPPPADKADQLNPLRPYANLAGTAAESVLKGLSSFSFKPAGVPPLPEDPPKIRDYYERIETLGRMRLKRWLALAQERAQAGFARDEIRRLAAAEETLDTSPGRPLVGYLGAATLELDVLTSMTGMETGAAKSGLSEGRKALVEEDANCQTLFEQVRNAERCRMGALLRWAQAWTQGMDKKGAGP